MTWIQRRLSEDLTLKSDPSGQKKKYKIKKIKIKKRFSNDFNLA